MVFWKNFFGKIWNKYCAKTDFKKEKRLACIYIYISWRNRLTWFTLISPACSILCKKIPRGITEVIFLLNVYAKHEIDKLHNVRTHTPPYLREWTCVKIFVYLILRFSLFVKLHTYFKVFWNFFESSWVPSCIYFFLLNFLSEKNFFQRLEQTLSYH